MFICAEDTTAQMNVNMAANGPTTVQSVFN
jgi:hypothetical protein